jgi:dTDP-4-amino-4,6-dideoxygalactose transaminase
MIPFMDLKAQYLTIKAEIDEAIGRVLESGQFVLGAEVEAFERDFAAYAGAAHGIAVGSGTAALHLALLAAGIGSGDEVITVPFTFVATVATICDRGARPVLVDIDPTSFTIDVTQIESAITARTKAIVPVHLYGQTADMDPIRTIADRHGLVVIEDAAQAHGAQYKSRPAGSLGHLACFSFYPTKNLGAYGEGGLIATSDDGFAERLRLLRNWGQTTTDQHVVAGSNERMHALQGAILRVKLGHLGEWTDVRREHAARYNVRLAGADVTRPEEMSYARHVYHQYAVRSRERDALRASLAADGIATGVHYPTPVHLQPAYAGLGYKRGAFPVSERASAEVLSLPVFPELTTEQIDTVAAAVRAAVAMA